MGFDAPIFRAVWIGDARLRLAEAFRHQQRPIDSIRGEVGNYGVGAAFGQAQIVFFRADGVRMAVNFEFGPREPRIFHA